MSTPQNFPLDTRILIVDDDATACQILLKKLGELGYEEVTSATDGTIAWQMIDENLRDDNPFGLVISDLEMEEIGGLELLKRIREDPRSRHIPFIMLTAYGEVNNLVNSVKAKVDDFIVKPLQGDTLKAKLERTYSIWIKRN